MHRLVQLTVRTWLKIYDQEEEWKNHFINNLHGTFPTGQYENWERCRSLFPHVRSAVLHQPKSRNSLRIWAALLYKGAWYTIECGLNETDLECDVTRIYDIYDQFEYHNTHSSLLEHQSIQIKVSDTLI